MQLLFLQIQRNVVLFNPIKYDVNCVAASLELNLFSHGYFYNQTESWHQPMGIPIITTHLLFIFVIHTRQ